MPGAECTHKYQTRGCHCLAQFALNACCGCSLESGPAIPGGVTEMNDHIGDRSTVELRIGARKFQLPGTDGSCSFKREVSLIVQVHFKQAVVIYSITGSDVLNGGVIVKETAIIGGG